MHFGTKSYLKSTRNHTAKHALKRKEAAYGGRGRFEDPTRRIELFYRLAFPLAA
jgi:hypothetical protein